MLIDGYFISMNRMIIRTKKLSRLDSDKKVKNFYKNCNESMKFWIYE